MCWFYMSTALHAPLHVFTAKRGTSTVLSQPAVLSITLILNSFLCLLGYSHAALKGDDTHA